MKKIVFLGTAIFFLVLPLTISAQLWLPNLYWSNQSEHGHFRAWGTWEALDFDMAYPTNLVMLDAWKNEGVLKVFTINISWLMPGNLRLSPPFIDEYEISSWLDNSSIVAHLSNISRHESIFIFFDKQQIVLKSISKSDTTDVRTMKLVDGSLFNGLVK